MTRSRNLTGVVVLMVCAGCGAQSGESGGGGMFSFFRNKDSVPTVVDPTVGAQLVRQSAFPATPPAVIEPAVTCAQRAVRGIPPQASLVDEAVPGVTTTAYVIDATSAHPPLALVNISGAAARVELWELSPDTAPTFVRQRSVRLDPEQDQWASFLLADVACMPGGRLLLAVFYYAPQVKQALFLYDIATDSYTKIAGVVPFADNRRQFFDLQFTAPDQALLLYYTAATRIAPEVYYNAPAHLRVFTSQQPHGREVLKLGAADGTVERWAIIDRTVWLQTQDFRERKQPKAFIWSLDLRSLLTR